MTQPTPTGTGHVLALALVIVKRRSTRSELNLGMSVIGTELPIPDVTVSVVIGGTADRDQPHSISSIYEDTTRSFEQSVS